MTATEQHSEIDPRVASAAAHWSHRFVTNGVPLADFQDVTGSIRHWDEWCAAWASRAEVHEGLAQAAFAGGYERSGAEHLSTAAVCYHFGKFLFVHDRAQMRAAHERAVDCRNRALPFVDPPGERVEIPWNGHTLYGNLRKPRGVERPPVVVMAMGLDSAKEEMPSNEQVFLDRGLATLAFDGPGQGEGEYDMPIHPAYEEPVSAVLDMIETRNDLDSDRVAIWGVSLGGYYAPRAAAYEDRLKACVSLTGPFDFAEAFDRAPPLTRAAFTARAFASGEDAAREVAAHMTLEEAAPRIRCPTYIVGGALDRVLPPDHAQRLADAVSGPVVLNMIEDGTHVANNRPYKYRTQVADWLADALAR
ncbi:alpha/beta hydrolase family protein [Histidinibacterium aquaticum]|uniref:Alpha/beta fold hydrolase n=1 Tax=Histidinibacterium aquaticum TaxID=2613962 RepID=A0A5J5GET7_9RHOB|nr:alpha/beta fold hydrolase [Histidinibacterium aquaticum]KAA9006766.1 alpha/beta fold hydrolase [Histidinibacterium aquaticum]